MNKSDLIKAKESTEGIKAFFDQLGNSDVYTKIVWETFFEELYENRTKKRRREGKAVSVSRQKR